MKRTLLAGLVIGAVEVKEEGTVAAAATAVLMKSAAREVPFNFDEPFLSLLVERKSSSILFVVRQTRMKED